MSISEWSTQAKKSWRWLSNKKIGFRNSWTVNIGKLEGGILLNLWKIDPIYEWSELHLTYLKKLLLFKSYWLWIY